MNASKSPLLSLRALLILMAVLTGLTWWIGTNVNRYTVQTSAVPSDFPGDISRWRLQENWKDVDTLPGFTLFSDGISISRDIPGISDAELRVPLPEQKPAGAKLLAQGELMAQTVSGGKLNWHGLLYTVWFYDASGERIKESARTVQALVGDTVPLLYSRELDLPPLAVEAGIGLRVFESTGTAFLRAPKLQVVAPWSGYRNVIMGVLAVWAVYGLVVVVALGSRGKLLYALVPIALIAIIAVAVSLPSEDLRRLIAPIEQLTKGVMPYLRELGLYSVNKMGHALSFALLAFFVCMVRKRLGATWLGTVSFMILLAVLTESVQLFFVGRSSRLIDVAIDLSGACFGILMFFILWLVSSPFRKKTLDISL